MEEMPSCWSRKATISRATVALTPLMALSCVTVAVLEGDRRLCGFGPRARARGVRECFSMQIPALGANLLHLVL